MSILFEKSRNELISQSKRGEREKGDGKTRYEKRLKSKISSSNRSYNRIDMNTLFKEGILTVGIEVKGETDNYIVKISYGNFIDTLRELMRNNNEELNLRVVIKTLTVAFNRGDVYVRCTCPDFCLEENTLIKLLSGESITVKEMLERFSNGEEIWVYSTDALGDFKPGKVEDVWISGYSNEMIKVTLDNNEQIITTPNHRYMLRNGEYKAAQQLNVNDSLMPMYFRYSNGYENYKKNSDLTCTKFYSVYKEVANTCLTKEIEDAKQRSGEDIIQIHHKDFNKLNNTPSNLYPMGKDEHWKYHYEHLYESGNFDKWIEGGKRYWSTEDARLKQSSVMKETMTKYYSNMTTEEISKMRSDKGCYSQEWKDKVGKGNKQAWQNYSDEEYRHRCEINKSTNDNSLTKFKQSERRKEYYKTHPKAVEISKKNLLKATEKIKGQSFSESHKNKISKSLLNRTQEEKVLSNRKIALTKLKKLFNYMIENGLNLDLLNYMKAIEYFKSVNKHITFPPYEKYFNSFDDMISCFKLNHKVKAIEHLHYDSPIPVYDINVGTYNNFLVNAGVVLHNCYRFGYWATINKFINGEPELRPANETNPDNKLGAACKHVLLVLGNSSWIIKVASVIVNYIKYMEKSQPRLYQRIIYPAVYGKKYEEPTQTSLFDTEEDELGTEQKDIDIANKAAIERSRFQKDNKQGIRYAPKSQIAGQQEIKIDDDEEEFND